jgi:hypothetical protein
MISKLLLACLGLALCVSVSAREKPFKIQTANFDKMRDPFTIMVPVRTVGGDGPCYLRNLDEEMTRSYSKAEWYFKERRFPEAENACIQGLELPKEYREPYQYPKYPELAEKLAILKKAAERMIKRNETEEALQKQKLEVSGVFNSVGRSRPLISFPTEAGPKSAVFRIGDKILDPESKVPTALSDAPTVREIQPRRVIVDYRGYKIELPVSSDTDEVEEALK